MSTSRSMTPLSKVLENLAEKGYGKEFVISEKGAQLDPSGKVYQPEQLKIIKIYRFEGESDPADMAVIYAINAPDGIHGHLMNAYGTYSDQDNPHYDDFIKKVPVDEMEEL